MTKRRIAAILVPVLAAIGIAAGTAAATTGGHSAAHPAARQVRPEVFNCQHAQVKPSSFTLTCADGNTVLTHLSWSSWTASAAHATGTEMVNDCTPYCAAGKFHGYRADVTFSRSVPLPGHPGQRYFSRVTVYFPGARPPVYSGGKPVTGPRTWTGVLSGPLPAKPSQLN